MAGNSELDFRHKLKCCANVSVNCRWPKYPSVICRGVCLKTADASTRRHAVPMRRKHGDVSIRHKPADASCFVCSLCKTACYIKFSSINQILARWPSNRKQTVSGQGSCWLTKSPVISEKTHIWFLYLFTLLGNIVYIYSLCYVSISFVLYFITRFMIFIILLH